MANANGTSTNLAFVLQEARAAIEAEWEVANRFDEKARGQATLAGAWFGISQAIAAAAVARHIHKCWVYVLGGGLALQAICLVLLLVATARVWKLRTERGVGVSSLRAMQNDAPSDSIAFANKAIDFYVAILEQASAANGERADAFDDGGRDSHRSYSCAMFWWWPVLIIGLIEMGVALLSQAL